MDEETEKHIIKHLVIAGGGTYGFQAYGALVESRSKGIWKKEDLVSCYGTSVGTILLIMLLLPYEEEDITKYFIGRPWHQLFQYSLHSIFSSFQENGIFNKHTFQQILDPLLKGADLDPNITLEEFHAFTKVEMHFFATKVNHYGAIDISYKTHPQWTLLDATYASCCLPILFRPLEHEDEFYIDGGVFVNYPLDYALKECHPQEIMAINKEFEEPKPMHKETTMFECIHILFNNTARYVDTQPITQIPYEITITAPQVTIEDFFKFAESETYRREWYELGRTIAKDVMETWKNEE